MALRHRRAQQIDGADQGAVDDGVERCIGLELPVQHGIGYLGAGGIGDHDRACQGFHTPQRLSTV